MAGIQDLIDNYENPPVQRSSSTGVSRLTGPTSVPQVQVPWYTPEQAPRLESSPGVSRLTGPATPPDGPLSRAAGMMPAAGAAGILAGGAGATAAATGIVASNPDYFKSSVGDDGFAANILMASRDSEKQQAPQQQTPRIAQLPAGNSTAEGGRGGDPRQFGMPSIISVAQAPQYDDTYRAQNLANNMNQAFREGDPIGDIIRQKLSQQGASTAAATPVNAGGIIGGGDTVYSPGQLAKTDPFKTADGRTLDPNDQNIAAADRAAIDQYRAGNAQTLAQMEQAQRTNPLAGAVQIIRPGNDVSYAVQAPERMVEMQPGAYAAYQSAIEKSPQLGSRMQMTEGGMTVDGLATPANVVGHGDATMQAYQANARKDAETGLDAATLAKIAEQQVKNQGLVDVAKIQAGDKHVPTGYRANPDGSVSPIKGGPADIGKALPTPAVKDLSAAGTSLENTRRLVGTFKDDFGGHYVMGDMSNKLGRLFGDDTGQAQWWQDMDTQQNQARHALFGSALTKSELAAWEKTSVTPGMDPKEIRKNLELRSDIEARAASKLARSYTVAGYNKDQINELLGSAAQYLDKPAPAVEKQGTGMAPKSGLQQSAVLQGTSTAAQKAPTIPPKAIDHLRSNPNLRDDFDAQFGQGAADSVLGSRKFANGGLIGSGLSNDDSTYPNFLVPLDLNNDQTAARQSLAAAYPGGARIGTTSRPQFPQQSVAVDAGTSQIGINLSDYGAGEPLTTFGGGQPLTDFGGGGSILSEFGGGDSPLKEFGDSGGILSRFANGGMIGSPKASGAIRKLAFGKSGS